MPRIEASLPAVLDDRLLSLRSLAPTRPPTRCGPKIRAIVDREVRRLLAQKDSRMDPAWVLTSIDVPRSAFFGLLRWGTTRVPVTMASWRSEWDRRGVLWWHFAWDAATDAGVSEAEVLAAARDAVFGSVTDGWGESVEQAARFGPKTTEDAEGHVHLANRKSEARPEEAGRYAVLLTLKGATFKIRRPG